MSKKTIPFVEGDWFTFTDEQGRELLDVRFEMDPGASLIIVEAFDTEGHAVAHLGVSFLGVGYPQHDGHDKPPLIVEKVIRKQGSDEQPKE